jgi:bile acid:Na+ symporter, BASS family
MLILTLLFLLAMMLSIGLQTTHRDLRATLGDRPLLGRLVVANVVLVPVLAAFAVPCFHLPWEMAVALLLLASAPGGTCLAATARSLEGSRASAAGLSFVLSALAVIATPVIANWLLPCEPSGPLAVLSMALCLTLLLFCPLALGYVLRDWLGAAAARLAAPVRRLALLCLAAVILLVMVKRWDTVRALEGSALPAAMVLALGMWVIGWVVGGPDSVTHLVAASSAGTRHVGLCLLIALKSFPETDVAAGVSALGLLFLLPGALLALWVDRTSGEDNPLQQIVVPRHERLQSCPRAALATRARSREAVCTPGAAMAPPRALAGMLLEAGREDR